MEKEYIIQIAGNIFVGICTIIAAIVAEIIRGDGDINKKIWYKKPGIWIAILAFSYIIVITSPIIIEFVNSKVMKNQNILYKFVKYAYTDEWEYDEEWTDEVSPIDDTCKLFGKRILYTGRRKIKEEHVLYKHVKYDENGNEDIIWIPSKISPDAYEYANEKDKYVDIRYENLGKWVTSRSKLGAYTYDVEQKEQYKYRRRKKYIVDVKYSLSPEVPEGYEKCELKID